MSLARHIVRCTSITCIGISLVLQDPWVTKRGRHTFSTWGHSNARTHTRGQSDPDPEVTVESVAVVALPDPTETALGKGTCHHDTVYEQGQRYDNKLTSSMASSISVPRATLSSIKYGRTNWAHVGQSLVCSTKASAVIASELG
jgi:hypothetical protein